MSSGKGTEIRATTTPLEEQRTAAGLSICHMAGAMGVDRRTYSTCEAGTTRSPRLLRQATIYVRHVLSAQKIALHLLGETDA